MNRYRFVAFALAMLMGFSVPLAAQKQKLQSPKTTAVLIARADSAFRSGQLEFSRRLYAHVLKVEPSNSRATYQLGRLAPPGSKLAIKHFRRYILLQPKDPWGYMALAEAYAKAGLFNPAVRWYIEAVIL